MKIPRVLRALLSFNGGFGRNTFIVASCDLCGAPSAAARAWHRLTAMIAFFPAHPD
jgi:hypothetical protein